LIKLFKFLADDTFSLKSPNDLSGFGSTSNQQNSANSVSSNNLDFQSPSNASFNFINGNNHAGLNQYKSIMNSGGQSEMKVNQPEEDDEDDEDEDEDGDEDEANDLF
jgi:hypothetical protein